MDQSLRVIAPRCYAFRWNVVIEHSAAGYGGPVLAGEGAGVREGCRGGKVLHTGGSFDNGTAQSEDAGIHQHVVQALGELMKYLVSRYCDFQIHSPRDRRYFGWEKEQMTLAALERWAEALLAECARRSIGSIAVTDHHDLWPGVIVLRKAHEIDATTWVFPGMEITSKSGIQAVLLIDPMEFGDMDSFDAGNAESVINRITASIGQNITAGPQGEKNLMVTPWTKLQGLASMKVDDRARVFLGSFARSLGTEMMCSARFG